MASDDDRNQKKPQPAAEVQPHSTAPMHEPGPAVNILDRNADESAGALPLASGRTRSPTDVSTPGASTREVGLANNSPRVRGCENQRPRAAGRPGCTVYPTTAMPRGPPHRIIGPAPRGVSCSSRSRSESRGTRRESGKGRNTVETDPVVSAVSFMWAVGVGFRK